MEFYDTNIVIAGDICGQLKTPPMVRDFSQTQKMMLSPTNPISYFGILRLAVCDSGNYNYIFLIRQS